MATNQAEFVSEKMEEFFGIIWRDEWRGVTDEDLKADFEKYWAGVTKENSASVPRAEKNVPQLVLDSSDLEDFSDLELVRSGSHIALRVKEAKKVYATLPYITYGGRLHGNMVIVPRPQLVLSPLIYKTTKGNITAGDWVLYFNGREEGFYVRGDKIEPEQAFAALKANQVKQLEFLNESGLELNAENLKSILESIEEFPKLEQTDLREFRVVHLEELFKQIRASRMTTSRRNLYILTYTDKFNAKYEDETNSPNIIVQMHKGNYKVKVDKYSSTLVSMSSQYTKNRDIYGMSYFYDPVFITDNRKAGLIVKLLPDVTIERETLVRNGKSPWELTPEDISGNEASFDSKRFISNNKLKRQWMYEKFLDQAMYLSKEDTYQLKARVVLTEFNGATLESGIVISESFAERCETLHEIQILTEGKSEEDAFYSRYPELAGKAREVVYRPNSADSVNVQFKIPLNVGDKMTNMHGNKGTISAILPDEDMPYITEEVGHVPAGPAEIVISNNIVDRATYGQLIEIFSLSNNRPDITNIKEFLDSGLPDNTNVDVEIYGEKYKRTSGLMYFCVMEHFSAIKQTVPGQKFLKLGEMECLLIGGLDQGELLREILAYSPTRRSDFKYQQLAKEPNEGILNNAVIDSLSSLGLDIKIDGRYLQSFNNSAPTEEVVEKWKQDLSELEI